MISQQFLDIAMTFDRLIKSYYELNHQLPIYDYILDEDSLKNLAATSQLTFPSAAYSQNRGGTWLLEEDQEYFLGVTFGQQIIHRLCSNDPRTVIHGNNLDALTVLIEEISHFNLLQQRINHKQKVKTLELEWQAEIDKFFILLIYLYDQGVSINHNKIYALIFNQVVFVSESEVYQTANRLAAQFCRNFMEQHKDKKTPQSIHSIKWRNIMLQFYFGCINKKLKIKDSVFV